MTFTILFVCTGNICRSPLAELLARAIFDEQLRDAARDVRVESAGTWGHEGSRMEPEAIDALAAYGVDGRAFRAREMTRDMVRSADLVLTAAAEHRTATVSLDEQSAPRVFGMAEFARLAAGVDRDQLPDDVVPRARAIVAASDAARAGQGLADAASGEDEDVADPYGAPRHVFAETAAQIRSLLAPFAAALRPPSLGTPVRSSSTHAGRARP